MCNHTCYQTWGNCDELFARTQWHITTNQFESTIIDTCTDCRTKMARCSAARSIRWYVMLQITLANVPKWDCVCVYQLSSHKFDGARFHNAIFTWVPCVFHPCVYWNTNSSCGKNSISFKFILQNAGKHISAIIFCSAIRWVSNLISWLIFNRVSLINMPPR